MANTDRLADLIAADLAEWARTQPPGTLDAVQAAVARSPYLGPQICQHAGCALSTAHGHANSPAPAGGDNEVFGDAADDFAAIERGEL